MTGQSLVLDGDFLAGPNTPSHLHVANVTPEHVAFTGRALNSEPNSPISALSTERGPAGLTTQ